MLCVWLKELAHWFRARWVLASILATAAVWGVVLAWPRSEEVEIVFCNAGQGDETLIQRGFTQILIDGSRPGQALGCLERHMPFFDRDIDMVMVSHPELDHFGGLEDVIKSYHVISFVYNGEESSDGSWGKLLTQVKRKNIPIHIVSGGEKLEIEGTTLTIISPDKKEVSGVLGASTETQNDVALVAKFRYGTFTALFTGDISAAKEREIAGMVGHIQVLKVAHHGSKYSSAQQFLDIIRPELAVIEVGKNSYGHPTKEAIDRLVTSGAVVQRTDQGGDIVVGTDGEKWGIEDGHQ